MPCCRGLIGGGLTAQRAAHVRGARVGPSDRLMWVSRNRGRSGTPREARGGAKLIVHWSSTTDRPQPRSEPASDPDPTDRPTLAARSAAKISRFPSRRGRPTDPPERQRRARRAVISRYVALSGDRPTRPDRDRGWVRNETLVDVLETVTLMSGTFYHIKVVGSGVQGYIRAKYLRATEISGERASKRQRVC